VQILRLNPQQGVGDLRCYKFKSLTESKKMEMSVVVHAILSAPGKHRQENCEFQASLSYTVRLSQTNKNKTKQNNPQMMKHLGDEISKTQLYLLKFCFVFVGHSL
jgi:hypothetical protein